MKSAARLVLGICLFAAPVAAQPAAPVPVEYQDLYAALSTSVTSFKATIEQQWDGTRVPVAFATNLSTADSSRGPALLAPNQIGSVRLELDSLKALGVKAVSLEINFPMLYEPFHGSQATYQQYLGFYQQVAQEVRARGLTLIVQTQALFSDGSVTGWNLASYYASLSLDQYEQGRVAVAETIAQNLNPDYLSVIQEPDTEAAETGQPQLGTLDGSAALLGQILGGLQALGIQGVAVGAGFGTWQSDYTSWANRFSSSSIDFLDMHVYPVNQDFLPRALAIADIARSYGKQVGMSEAWLYKVRDSELQSPTSYAFLARDVFSFWAPLDTEFLQTMVEFAELKQLAFMSPFWSAYFHAYVDYGPTTSNLSPGALNQLAQAALATNMLGGTYTSTGLAYKDAILDSPDVTPPSPPPGGVSALLTSPTSVVVYWSAASDNIGTSAYQIFRDGVLLSQTAWTGIRDTGLDQARTYSYAVVATDASGNQATPSTVSITTPDTTSPSVPAGLTAVAVTSGSSITVNLTWLPSTDNVGVAHYRIYRGTSPGGLSLIALSDTPSYAITNAPPNTTWYFAVSAIDAAWNDSGQCAPVAVTTPAAPDVTPPTVSISWPTGGSRLSRTVTFYAAACDMRGGLYDVPSGVAGVQFQIDGVDVGAEQTVPSSVSGPCGAYQLSYDTRRQPNGTHTIAARARDAAGNRATSAGVTVRIRN